MCYGVIPFFIVFSYAAVSERIKMYKVMVLSVRTVLTQVSRLDRALIWFGLTLHLLSTDVSSWAVCI